MPRLFVHYNFVYLFSFKTLFWLPKILPSKVHLIVSVNNSDVKKVAELTEERGYAAIDITPLNEAQKEEIALVS